MREPLREPFLDLRLKMEASSSESPSPPPPNPLSKLRRNYSEPAKLENLWDGIRRLDSEIESVFSSIRSQSDDDIEEELAKVNAYATAGPCRRAFPERFLALLVTLAVEVPVALIITGGSKELKSLVGLERYTLLMAFLPLTSAISGNVGLQASSLTTRAISHGSCAKATYCAWMCTEMSTACLLSLTTGLAVGLLAIVWTWQSFESGIDVGFSLTVAIAQAFSIIVAGLTGSAAPLVFSFLFHGDAGKWAGPMETAIQDVAGAFGVVYIAQFIMVACVKYGLSPSTGS